MTVVLRSSPAAIHLIVAAECPGGAPPLHPYWPEGSITSGVTCGVGDDLGQRRAGDPLNSWAPHLGAVALEMLRSVCGVRGFGARDAVAGPIGGIIIPADVSEQVFATDSLPKYEQQLLEVMPGADQLPADVFGALTDMIFNRGDSLLGDRRLEMRMIAGAVAAFAATSLPDARAASLRAMVNQLHLMADRLWPVPSANRWDTILHARRLDEAALIAAVAVQLDPTTP